MDSFGLCDSFGDSACAFARQRRYRRSRPALRLSAGQPAMPLRSLAPRGYSSTIAGHQRYPLGKGDALDFDIEIQRPIADRHEGAGRRVAWKEASVDLIDRAVVGPPRRRRGPCSSCPARSRRSRGRAGGCASTIPPVRRSSPARSGRSPGRLAGSPRQNEPVGPYRGRDRDPVSPAYWEMPGPRRPHVALIRPFWYKATTLCRYFRPTSITTIITDSRVACDDCLT